MPRITYDHDRKGNISLPSGPPFDGEPVLIRLAAGWVEAWWDDARKVDTQYGIEHEGFNWVCMDDNFQADLDDAKDWLPLPQYRYRDLWTRFTDWLRS
jgi:hypothetical protein